MHSPTIEHKDKRYHLSSLTHIATPPTGGLNLFNLYVALSRSSGRETIRLLKDFDDSLFEKQHDAALLQEDQRLEKLDRETHSWHEKVIEGFDRLKKSNEWNIPVRQWIATIDDITYHVSVLNLYSSNWLSDVICIDYAPVKMQIMRHIGVG